MNRHDILAKLPERFTSADVARIASIKRHSAAQVAMRMVLNGEATCDGTRHYVKTGKIGSGVPLQICCRVDAAEYQTYVSLGGSSWLRSELHKHMRPKEQQTPFSGLGARNV